MSENVTLSAKQLKAIGALMTGGSVRNAAKLCKISERQIYRWLKEDGFKSELQRRTDETFEATIRGLSDASLQAVVTLKAAMNKQDAPLMVKVRAASAVLGHFLKVKEIAELEPRLRELERVLTARKGKR